MIKKILLLDDISQTIRLSKHEFNKMALLLYLLDLTKTFGFGIKTESLSGLGCDWIGLNSRTESTIQTQNL